MSDLNVRSFAQRIQQLDDENATLRVELQTARLSESINVNERNDIIQRMQAENERLRQDKRNQYDVLWGLIDELKITQVDAGCPDAQIRDCINDLRAQLYRSELRWMDVEQQLAAVNNALPDFVQADGTPPARIAQLETMWRTAVQQLAAMTLERNELTETCVKHFHQAQKEREALATMTKDRDDWVTEAEQFSAKHAASEAKVLALEATLESKAH